MSGRLKLKLSKKPRGNGYWAHLGERDEMDFKRVLEEAARNSALAPSVQIFLLGTLFCVLVPFIYVPIICCASALGRVIERRPSFAPSIKLLSGLLLTFVVVLLV